MTGDITYSLKAYICRKVFFISNLKNFLKYFKYRKRDGKLNFQASQKEFPFRVEMAQ